MDPKIEQTTELHSANPLTPSTHDLLTVPSHLEMIQSDIVHEASVRWEKLDALADADRPPPFFPRCPAFAALPWLSINQR